MSLDLVTDDELRAVLRPHRVDPDVFKEGIRARLNEQQHDPLARVPRPARAAAAFLPLNVITGGKMQGAFELAPPTGAYKLLGYAAFPAVSLFILVGAAIFSALKIRKTQAANTSGALDEKALFAATKGWWLRHAFAAVLVFAGTLVMSRYGETWLLFVGYILSFAVLLYVLKSLAQVGIGNRLVVGQSCLMAPHYP